MTNTEMTKILFKAWHKILKEQIEISRKIAENPEQREELTAKFLALYMDTTRIHKAIHAIQSLHG